MPEALLTQMATPLPLMAFLPMVAAPRIKAVRPMAATVEAAAVCGVAAVLTVETEQAIMVEVESDRAPRLENLANLLATFMQVVAVVAVHHLRPTPVALVVVVTAAEKLPPERQTLAEVVALAILELRRLAAVPVL